MVPEAGQEAALALGRNPNDAEALYLSGQVALARGEVAAAAAALLRAAELAPRNAHFLHDLGVALDRAGNKREALAAFAAAVALRHDYVSAIFHSGQLHAELGEREDARDRFSLALAFDPRSSAARIALSRLLAESEGLEAAIALLRDAIEEQTADAAVYCRLAVLLKQRGDGAGAEALYKAAIGRFPKDPAPLVNLGVVELGQSGDPGKAEALFLRALELRPDLVEAQANLGLALQEQGRFDEALAHYERMIPDHPDELEFRWNRGIANLISGNFATGWEDYELRKARPDAGGVHESFKLPKWDGAPLTNRAILVYGEQGLGDEIMFASCLPDVIAQARWCVVECDARLEKLYRRSFPAARIEPRARDRVRDWRTDCPELELQCAVGSLPRFMRRRQSDFPDHKGYLRADPVAVERWRAHLRRFGTSHNVGISWRGGSLRTRSVLRSLPTAQLAALIDDLDATFVVLQRDLAAEERAMLELRSNVYIPDGVGDPDELAALISALDLTISVPSTTVHLTGALGRPLWVLLNYSPEWRYLWQGEIMPWYPSARLFRQPKPGDWPSVINEARTAFLQGAGASARGEE